MLPSHCVAIKVSFSNQGLLVHKIRINITWSKDVPKLLKITLRKHVTTENTDHLALNKSPNG